MDGLSFEWMLISMASVFVLSCLALIGKCGKNSWWVFGRNWFNVFTGNGVVRRQRRRRGTLVKWQLKQVLIFFFEQRSFHLSMHLGRLNSDGGKDWLPFFADFINWKKEIFTLPERSFLAGAQGIRSRLLRGTEFWVLLNFDNVLEAPRSIRRNHHCGIRTNWTYAENKISIAFLYLAQYLPSLLLYLKTWRYRNFWSWQCRGRVSYKLRNRPRSP